MKNMVKNKYSHILYREGYGNFKDLMIIKKRKQRQEDLGDASLSLDRSSSPPSCHEKRKRARQSLRREYTSEDIHVVAKKDYK